MSSRTGLVIAASLALIAGGCASSSGGGSGAAADPLASALAAAQAEASGRDLPVGIEPRDDEHTRLAQQLFGEAEGLEGAEFDARVREALGAAQSGIAADAENPRAWFEAGRAYLAMGNLAEADRHFTRAEELHPRYWFEITPIREQEWVSEFNLAVEELDAGNNPQAIQHLEAAHTIFRGRPEAMLNLGSLYAEAGRNADAIRTFQEALDFINGPEAALQEEELQASWRENERIVELNLAQLLRQEGRNEEAIRVYESYLEKDPDDITATSGLAVLLSEVGRDAEAEAIFDSLLNRPGLTSFDYFFAGIGLFQAENHEGAARAFARALELDPNSRDAAYNLTQAHYLAAVDGEGSPEQWERVVESAEKLIAIDSHNVNAFRILAQSQVRLDRESDAVETLEKMQALPFDLQDLQLQPIAGGGAVIQGEARNQTLDAGSTVTLVFTFYGRGGQTLGTQNVSFQVGEADSATGFEVNFSSSEQVASYGYRIGN